MLLLPLTALASALCASAATPSYLPRAGSGSGGSAASGSAVPKFTYSPPNHSFPGVQATGKNGPTNPDKPSLHTPVNQTSDARLASLNSIDDWCTFGPEPLHNKDTLGDLEQTTVAYCTQPRNNARVIPDGSIKSASFIRTPLYIELHATGDFTSLNFAPGDSGGELDPHGATNKGNPVGGNVTSNIVDGKTDVAYQEWMNYVSATELCFRVCIAGSEDATPENVCQHTLDEVGCSWIMPQAPSKNDFETCDADAAYPPGMYPQPDGKTSTFQQYFTGEYTVNGTPKGFTNGAKTETTPTAAYSIPSSSNCKSQTSISNGIASLKIASSSSSGGASAAASGKSSASGGSGSGGKSASSGASSSIVFSASLLGLTGLVAGALLA